MKHKITHKNKCFNLSYGERSLIKNIKECKRTVWYLFLTHPLCNTSHAVRARLRFMCFVRIKLFT